ncbi:hypothetical protein N6H14_17915 [Paenibacillus sp. CC-CFT747]|nr:hypothetical protein N6H14_17915 [Paenibacillus sp. CC-CFT747]
MKRLETELALIRHRLHSQGYMDLPAVGSSMFPYIRQGMICRFVPVKAPDISPGDILLFHDQAGRLVAHRCLRLPKDNGETGYVCKGDANVGYDQPIEAGCIVGKLAYVHRRRAGERLEPMAASVWRFAAMNLPFTSPIVRRYLDWKERLLS